jgi:hypothetical protein
MNAEQELWYAQAVAGRDVFRLLRLHGVHPCHQLHYLQMMSEKLAKAYLWRNGRAPAVRSHAAFVGFLKSLGSQKKSQRTAIAGSLGFSRLPSLDAWLHAALPLAHAVQNLAPSLAGDNGPNPEYPWPFERPYAAPVRYRFPIWDRLTRDADGRQFLRTVLRAVETFPQFA